MFERQMQVSQERMMYLQSLKGKGGFDGVVVTPTVLSMSKEMDDAGEKGDMLLSLVCFSFSCRSRSSQ